MMRALSIAVLLAAAPALAQPPAAPTSAVALDPARLAGGRALAAKTVPTGAYGKVLEGSMPQITDGFMKQMLNVPVKQLAGMAGMSNADTSKLNNATIKQIMEIMDPAYEQRMQISMHASMAAMGEVITKFEPELREGLAEAYAARFTVAQLAELNRFFTTPTGAAFAGQQMTLMNDPAVQKRMQMMLPLIIKQLPEIAKRVEAETAALPKAKTAAELSDADRAKLAQLLGTTPDKLKPQAAK